MVAGYSWIGQKELDFKGEENYISASKKLSHGKGAAVTTLINRGTEQVTGRN
jgi:hypothetical protein